MSLKVRRFIGYWFMLLLGMFILFIQAKKFYLQEYLTYTYEQLTVEAVVTCISIIMVLRPLALIELIQMIVKLRNGKINNE